MTPQQTNQPPQQRPQYLEDRKAQKLIQRIEAKLKAQENAARTSAGKN
jgi:hypothetical protein